jgi:beta-lactamase regulating signal transducer with metallopeptidase domain/tetratricopeptide (TPR) repeat protein
MATIFDIAARLQAAGAAEGMLLIVVKATLILAIARLFLMAIPRAAGATKHLVATTALVAVGLMPVFTLIVPAWHIAVERAEKVAAPPVAPPPATSGAEATIAAPTAPKAPIRTTDAVLSIARATGVVAEEPLTAMERAMNVGRSTWKGMIAFVVAAFALIMLIQMALGMLGVWFVARNAEELTHDQELLLLDQVRDELALKFEVRLLRSARISVPVIWGFIRPVLLLPADVVTWPAERLRVVLLHELAHLKRFDGISLLLTRIAVSLFWFHPLAWSLERAGRSECERACDDLVLANGTKPSDYADHLLAIARSMPTFDPFRSVTLAMSRKSQLEGRLLSILQPHVARRVFSGRGVAMACVLAIAVIVPVSALRLTAEPPDQKKVAEKKSAEPRKSDATVTVTPELEAIQDYLLTKLGKYDKRADRFARQPRNGEEWYERAYDLYRSDRHEEAAAAFHRAAEENYKRATALYNEACAYALLGDANRAIPALQEALRAGWDDIDHIADDSDFDPIRSDPRFAQVVSTNQRELVTRRLDETVARYKSLREGVEGGVAGGIEDGIRDGIKDGIRDGIKDGIRHGFKVEVDGEDFDFNFDSNHDDDWFEVGLDLLRLRRLDESIDAFQRSIAEREKPDTSMYNIACAYSLKGDAKNGMAWLEKAIEAGFGSADKLENDSDIALLRTQAGFDQMKRKSRDLQLRGCCDTGSKWLNALVSDNWQDAQSHHREIANRYPTSGRAWFNLGFVSIRADDYQTAHQAFRRSIELGYRKDTSTYNMACAYALEGNTNAAFEYLNKARALGFNLRNQMGGDDDLDSLHDDPRWDALKKELKVKERKHSEKHTRKHTEK